MVPHPETWLRVRPEGLWCEPADLFIDPVRPVPRAVVTHAHADHARPGHGAVLATPETMRLMEVRIGEARVAGSRQSLPLGETLALAGGATLRLAPAGHVLGSAQVVLEWRGSRLVVSGDYKRAPDRTATAFEPVPCDVFVTEATFALPLFRHPAPENEIDRLLASVALFPERTHVVGAYALGKTQRVIATLRDRGYDRPIHIHGALAPVCGAYEAMGVALGPLLPATVARGVSFAGCVVIAPPSAIGDRWARRFAEPVTCLASGWMRVRQRARARGVELPLVISDHADWAELNRTIDEVGAPEIWVTHGREEALIHEVGKRGIRGRALRLIGYDDESEGEAAAPEAPPSNDPSDPDGTEENP